MFIGSFASSAMAFDWIRFTSQEGGFSVLMPGPDAPKDKRETTNDAKNPAASPYTSHLFQQTSANGVMYLVGWVDYAPGFTPNAHAELAANRDSFTKGIDATLGSERSIALGQNPGIEFTASRTDGSTIKSRVYMVGARPYMLVTVAPKGMNDAANIDRFLASFTLNTTASNTAPKWLTLSPAQGKFSVMMPGDELPVDKAETVTEAKVAASAPYTTHLFVQKANGMVFLVGYVDYAPGYKPDAQAEIEANRDNFNKGIKGQLLSSRAITFEGHLGLEFTATRENDEAAIRSRVFMVGTRPYMIVVVSPKGMDSTKYIDRFFNSFTLKR